MKRIKLEDRELPVYTKGEEIFNMVSHIVGGAIGIIALILCLIFSIMHGNPYAIVSSIIYGISIIVLYTMSSIYHGLSPKIRAKKVLQVIDHCSIFLLISGSYTPFCLVTFLNYDVTLGWVMFSIVWGFAILGIVLNSIDLRRYRVFSMICYLAMGWCIIFNILPDLLTVPGFALLLSGGIVYSIGAIWYGFGKKLRYAHSIFHLFIVLGTLLQFLCIVMYVV